VNRSRKHDSAPNALHLPTPDELVDAPELAILHALDQILNLAPRVLVTAHPQLADPDAPFWVIEASKPSRTAAAIVADAHRLQRFIRAYRTAVSLARDQRREVDPEIPF
jgi:hypothetical protein